MKKSPFAFAAVLALVLSLGGCVWYGPGGYGYGGGWGHDGGGWHGDGDGDHGGGGHGGWH